MIQLFEIAVDSHEQVENRRRNEHHVTENRPQLNEFRTGSQNAANNQHGDGKRIDDNLPPGSGSRGLWLSLADAGGSNGGNLFFQFLGRLAEDSMPDSVENADGHSFPNLNSPLDEHERRTCRKFIRLPIEFPG